MTPDELVRHYPVLHHMTAAGAWASIRRIGLRTTAQLVGDCHPPPDAAAILTRRRTASLRLTHPTVGAVTVRDQGPLQERHLVGVAMVDWLAVLNRHVFFWLHPARLDGLLGARLYRDLDHDVLAVRTADLLDRCGDRVRITAMNTGATLFASAPPRGPESFLRVADFPFAQRRRRHALRDNAVELAVVDGVPDIADLVFRVERRRGTTVVDVVGP